MLLQQTSAEADAIVSVYDKSAPVAATSDALHSARYDAATTARALALAEDLQIRHQQTLTASEIENIGDAFGVKPEFVRRALAQIDAEPQTQKTTANPARRVLTRQDWKTAAIPAVVYALLVPLIMAAHPVFVGAWSLILPFFVPAFIAFYTGFQKQSKRLGAWSGTLLAFVGLAYCLLSDAIASAANRFPLSEFFSWGFLVLIIQFVVLGALPGIGGALLRQWIGMSNGKKEFHTSEF